MMTPLRRVFHTSKFMREERGTVIGLVAMAMPVLLGVGALAIDLSRMYVTEGKLQHTADAAALAGISAIAAGSNAQSASADADDPDVCANYADEFEIACRRAIGYANSNMPSNDHGRVLLDNDVHLGCWDPAVTEFEKTGKNGCTDTKINAVKVTTSRANDRPGGDDNALRLFLASTPLIDQDFASLRASATAALNGNGSVPCLSARSGDFDLGSNTELDLPNCTLGTNGKLTVKGSAGGLGDVAGLTYRQYDGGGNADGPEGDFDNVGRVKRLTAGESLQTPQRPDDASELNSICESEGGSKTDNSGSSNNNGNGNGNQNGNGGKYNCDLSGGGDYFIDGDLKVTGNSKFYFPNTGVATRIFVSGEFKLRGSARISGCFEIIADSVDINGTPFVSNDLCENNESKTVVSGQGGYGLVQ